jgi:sugar/nucleoside kinase (ribokinase family)
VIGKQAVVAGHICLDIFPGLDHLPEGGMSKVLEEMHLLHVGPAVLATGGPVPNTGLALHRLGIPTRLMAKVGADFFGQAVRGLVAGEAPELAEGVAIDPWVSTAYTIIFSAPGMDRIFLGHPGASDTYGVEDIDYALVSQVNLFHFGYPPVMKRMYENGGVELKELFRRAKAAGRAGKPLTSLDMTLPDPMTEGGRADWRLILREVLPYVDIFLPSFEELFFMLQRGEYEALLSAGEIQQAITPELLHSLSGELLELGVKLVVIKLGGKGLYLRTATASSLQELAGSLDADAWGDKEMWVPCFKVEVLGTTGAGDATIAGFLSGLLRGLTPAETMIMAVAVGGCNVEAVDALSGICSWEETCRRVQSGWKRHELELAAPGWKWNEMAGLWESRE